MMSMVVFKKTKDTIVSVWEINESLDELKKLLVDEGVPKSLNKKRQLEWLSARALLKKIDKRLKISYNTFGAPILSNKKHISITHSGIYVGIIISNHKSGIDIEKISNKALQLSSKFVSLENTNNLSEKDATLIWCIKESIYKWHQKGGINFKDDIRVKPYKLDNEGNVIVNFKRKLLNLHYLEINNHFLVYFCK